MEVASGFNTIVTASLRSKSQCVSLSRSQLHSEGSDKERTSTFLDDGNNKEQGSYANADINVVFIDEEDADVDDTNMVNSDEAPMEPSKGRNWFENIKPKFKKRLLEEGQAKAIANKKKREPSEDKRRRKYLLASLLFSVTKQGVFCSLSQKPNLSTANSQV